MGISAHADPPSPAGPLVSGRATGAASAGDFYTPEALVRFMCGLLDIKGGSLYDPCCGSGALLIGAARSLPESAPRRLYGQAADAWTYQLCRMNLLLEGLFADLGGRPANALTEDLHPDRRFDFILANPPFNLPHWCEDVRLLPDTLWQYGPPPRSNANFAWLQHIIRHMADESRAAVLLPNGALTSQTRAERQIREGIVRDGLVEAVLALPAGLFYCTKIPCSLWLLHKTRHPASSVLLVDARERSLRGADGDGAALTELVLRYRAGEALKSTGSEPATSLWGGRANRCGSWAAAASSPRTGTRSAAIFSSACAPTSQAGLTASIWPGSSRAPFTAGRWNSLLPSTPPA